VATLTPHRADCCALAARPTQPGEPLDYSEFPTSLKKKFKIPWKADQIDIHIVAFSASCVGDLIGMGCRWGLLFFAISGGDCLPLFCVLYTHCVPRTLASWWASGHSAWVLALGLIADSWAMNLRPLFTILVPFLILPRLCLTSTQEDRMAFSSDIADAATAYNIVAAPLTTFRRAVLDRLDGRC